MLWRENLFNCIKDRVTAALLEQVEKDRNGEDIDASLLKGVIDSYGAPHTPLSLSLSLSIACARAFAYL